MGLRDSLSEFVVRTPAFSVFEKHLRDAIHDNETRFRAAGEMLFYVEKNPRLSPQQRLEFRAELETKLGKAQSEKFFTAAQKIYNAYRLALHVMRIIWLILFVFGVWVFGRLFVNWGWNSFASLLAAAFVTGAVIELLKWSILLFLVWRRS